MYTCTICHEVNHPSRLHCRVCGTAPAMYSLIGIPSRNNINWRYPTPTVAAIGCARAGEQRLQRVKLQTVPLDYYGEC